MNNEVLLVASSNNGGLSIILDNSKVLEVDSKSTTGLEYHGGKVYRAIQKSTTLELIVYSQNGIKKRFYSKIKDVHDIKFFKGKLYVVSTGSNEIFVLNENLDVEKILKYDGTGDSWHLNCLMIYDNKLYCSAFCEIKEHYKYKGNTFKSGFVFEIESLDKIITKLSQPHSPFYYKNHIYICNSETKEVLIKNLNNELSDKIGFENYTRGLYINNDIAYIGLSKSRTNTEPNEKGKIIKYDLNNSKEIESIKINFDEVYDIKCIDKKLVDIIVKHPYKTRLIDYIRYKVEKLMNKKYKN